MHHVWPVSTGCPALHEKTRQQRRDPAEAEVKLEANVGDASSQLLPGIIDETRAEA